MKEAELRIGNLYNSAKFNIPVECEMADMYEIYQRAEGATPDSSHVAQLFQPIPLDEQWLKKFGFEHRALRVFYIKIPNRGWHLGIKLTSNDEGIVMIKNDGFDTAILNQDIKYAHQLQNLYHALTGEELKTTE